MRAVLIDPYTKTISEVQYNGNYRHIYELLSNPFVVDCFCAVGIQERHTIWVDDEGLFKPKEEQQYFTWFGYPQPLAGKGLILRTTPDGESAECKIPVSEVMQNVRWANVEFVGNSSFEAKSTDPVLGEMDTLTIVPHFKQR